MRDDDASGSRNDNTCQVSNDYENRNVVLQQTRVDNEEDSGRRSITTAVLAVICTSLLLRIYGAAVLGLGVDESYALAVSRVPTLSFFDHPPLGFMLARWTAEFLGTEGAFGVRVPYLILFTGSSFLLYRLSCRLFTPDAGFWAVAWFSAAPFFLISVGSWVVPDGPLTFFLLLAANLLCPQIMDDQPSHAFPRWMAVGAAMGFAALSKYLAFLVGFGALVFLLANGKGRRWLFHPGPYAAALITLALFTPVFIWNAEHDWQSFVFQGGRAVAGHGLTFASGSVNTMRMIFGQAIYLLPGPFLLSIWLLWRAMRTRTRTLETGFCAALALPSILLFNGLAPLAKNSLPHWPMAGFIFVFPLIGDWIARLKGRYRNWVRQNLVAAGLLVGLIVLIGAPQFSNGFLTRIILTKSPPWDDTTQAMDWFDLKRGLRERGWLKPSVVVAAKDWVQAAKISYALGADIPVIVLKDDRRHFTFLETSALQGARSILLIGLMAPGDEHSFAAELKRLASGRFCGIKNEPAIALTRGGLPYRKFAVLSAKLLCRKLPATGRDAPKHEIATAIPRCAGAAGVFCPA